MHQSVTGAKRIVRKEVERDLPLVVVEVFAYVGHRHAGLVDDISRDHGRSPSKQIGNIHPRIIQRRRSISETALTDARICR